MLLLLLFFSSSISAMKNIDSCENKKQWRSDPRRFTVGPSSANVQDVSSSSASSALAGTGEENARKRKRSS